MGVNRTNHKWRSLIKYAPVSSQYVYTGGLAASSITTRQYDTSGSLQWSVDHGGTVNDVDVDDNGNLYAVGALVSGVTLRKYDSTGTTQSLTLDHGGSLFGVDIDSSGNIYTVGALISSVTTRKYNSSGTEQWNVNHGAQVNCVVVDQNGNVYTGGQRNVGFETPESTTRKYDSDGNLIWSVDHGAGEGPGGLNPILGVIAIAVDTSGNVYTVGVKTKVSDNPNADTMTTRKYDSDGNLIWSVSHTTSLTGRVTGIAVDTSGNVYTGGYRSADGFTTRKYNSSGTLIWSVDHGGFVEDLEIDVDGNVYTTGAVSSSLTTRKYDNDGNLIWSVNHGTTGNGVVPSNRWKPWS
jgi:streptogramin lyase